MFAAGIAVVLVASAEYPANEEMATFQLIKTALENDQVNIKLDCDFDIAYIAATGVYDATRLPDDMVRHSAPIRNVHCRGIEVFAGKR